MNYDLLIVGGGMVGASLAVALKDLPLRIGLLEAVAPGEEEQPSFDARAIALSQGSTRILDAMGVWPAMQELGVTAINTIHISERGGFGSARLTSKDEGVDALGYVVESRVIGQTLNAQLEQQHGLDMICPARLTQLKVLNDGVEVSFEQDGEILSVTTRLLIAADGGHSMVRELMQPKYLRLGYGQTAVITTVASDRPHQGVAYERFTDTGPLALLPCDPPLGDVHQESAGRRWSVVWTVRDAQVEEILGWDDETFLQQLQERFGYRAGHFDRIAPRHAYPLALNYVREHVQPRMAYIGNAAHAIHPVAGQGYNLGLRDVASLAEVISTAHQRGEDIGSSTTLSDYAKWRRPDYLRVMGFTDSLVRIFSNRISPLGLARNVGLLALDILPGAKHLLARQAMGLNGRLPRLARGLPLINASSQEKAS